MNLTTLAKLPGASRLSTLLFSVEEAWFDASRGVHTSQEVDLRGLNLVGQRKDSFKYRPIRPSIARKILRDLPITDPVQYTFIDVGSGKGRMLFLAAEYRFREIQGIEFAAELHDSAEANIRSYHSSKQRCSRIRSLLLNASDYSFPDDNLVIYFFNPFGHQVMSDVVQNLETSLGERPRDMLVIMVYPDFAYLLDSSKSFHLLKARRRYRIYRTQMQRRG